ncbi:beta-ketoacyl synthase chain length factor [Pseudoalteromonas sp. BDTF-M6]|uniref:beta-ketoacyl synthase chain length factor n=1 Tax=Pseudoalteromonas sp. BDTF-M6 TaxID=2796132 RepID=UPI001BAFDC54|nr:beta-ketoacyl synthase chain length factor [Pseudoalteromonas sp. BDTF-M6]MBS3797726.1 beta-ketoacyl synthase chain length factor [Pseudoalteromonas sp. BDTF-M6]
MKCAVEKLAVYVAQPASTENIELNEILDALASEFIALDVSWVKPIQRRRLSHFAKMILSCAHQVNPEAQPMPIIFSSRHGDLHKTSDLLAQLQAREPLSPTQFGLSVHNAVAGLLSILTNNKAPIVALAGGSDSINSALCEAYMQLQDPEVERVMVIHADRALPELYQEFAYEPQLDHCVALVMSKVPEAIKGGTSFRLEQSNDAAKLTQLPALYLAQALLQQHSTELCGWRLHYD